MAAAFSIKGSSLASKLEYVREVHGTDAEAELKGWLREHDISLLLVSEWYPHAIYTQLNEAIAAKLLGGDLARLREVGVFSARRALDTVYKAYLNRGDFGDFLNRLASLHERFFNQGSMSVSTRPKAAEIRLSGAPVYPPADMEVARGFYTGAADRFGFENTSCDVQLLGDSAVFQLRW